MDEESIPSSSTLAGGGKETIANDDPFRKRTKDIQIDHDIDFSELLLSPPILKGLNEAGYPFLIEIYL